MENNRLKINIFLLVRSNNSNLDFILYLYLFYICSYITIITVESLNPPVYLLIWSLRHTFWGRFVMVEELCFVDCVSFHNPLLNYRSLFCVFKISIYKFWTLLGASRKMPSRNFISSKFFFSLLIYYTVQAYTRSHQNRIQITESSNRPAKHEQYLFSLYIN